MDFMCPPSYRTEPDENSSHWYRCFVSLAEEMYHLNNKVVDMNKYNFDMHSSFLSELQDMFPSEGACTDFFRREAKYSPNDVKQLANSIGKFRCFLDNDQTLPYNLNRIPDRIQNYKNEPFKSNRWERNNCLSLNDSRDSENRDMRGQRGRCDMIKPHFNSNDLRLQIKDSRLSHVRGRFRDHRHRSGPQWRRKNDESQLYNDLSDQQNPGDEEQFNKSDSHRNHGAMSDRFEPSNSQGISDNSRIISQRSEIIFENTRIISQDKGGMFKGNRN